MPHPHWDWPYGKKNHTHFHLIFLLFHPSSITEIFLLLERYPTARKCSIVLNKDSHHASRMIFYNIGTCKGSKLNMVQVAKSDAYNGSWEEYKVKKLANYCRTGRKLWRGEGEEASADEYDPMGDTHSAFAVDMND